MNFSTLHGAWKDSLVSAGFRYVNANNWYNLEIGILPESALNDGFTIRFVSQESSINSDNLAILNVEVEFAFDTKHDNYLAKIGTAQTAIRALQGVLKDASIVAIEDHLWPSFVTAYLGEIVTFTFDKIKVEIDSN